MLSHELSRVAKSVRSSAYTDYFNDKVDKEFTEHEEKEDRKNILAIQNALGSLDGLEREAREILSLFDNRRTHNLNDLESIVTELQNVVDTISHAIRKY